MSFELSHSLQSQDIEVALKAAFFKKLYEVSTENVLMHAGGLPIGLASGILTIAKRIGLIFENLIKGTINILGSPFFKQCHFSKGFGQLTGKTLYHIVALPFSILSAGIDVLWTTASMVKNPAASMLSCWHEHDPVAKKAHEARVAQARFDEQQNQFNIALGTLRQNPNDIFSLKHVASCYAKGQVSGVDRSEAIPLYERAANLGDIDSMNFLCSYFSEGEIVEKNHQSAIFWAEKAASLGDIFSMTTVGIFYLAGVGTEKNEDLAFKWFDKAAQNGCPFGMQQLGRIYAKRGNYPQAVNWWRKGMNQNNSEARERIIPYLSAILIRRPNLAEYRYEGNLWVESGCKWENVQKAIDDLDIPNETT